MNKEAFLTTAFSAMRKAGERIQFYVDHTADLQLKLKKHESPVTQADIESNDILTQAFQTDFPELEIISEEGEQTNTGQQYQVIFDPLDGTRPFARGMKSSAILLALLENGEPTIGIAYNPFVEMFLWGIKGEGAFITSPQYPKPQPAKVSQRATLPDSYVTHANIKQFVRPEIPYRLGRLGELTKEVKYLCSYPDNNNPSLFDLATGKIDGQLEPWGFSWDFYAGLVIIEAAGGKVTDFDGNPFTSESRSYLASNGLIHDKLVTFFK